MVTVVEDVPRSSNATFLRNSATMAKKAARRAADEDSGGDVGGRPPHSDVTAEQFRAMAKTLESAVSNLKEIADFMDENKMSTIRVGYVTNAAKALSLSSWSKRTLAEVGPSLYAEQMGVKSRTEQNRERYEKYQKGKKP